MNMEMRLQQLMDINSMIVDAKKRAFEYKRDALFYKKVGFNSVATQLLHNHYISHAAAERLQAYLNEKIKGLANEI